MKALSFALPALAALLVTLGARPWLAGAADEPFDRVTCEPGDTLPVFENRTAHTLVVATYVRSSGEGAQVFTQRADGGSEGAPGTPEAAGAAPYLSFEVQPGDALFVRSDEGGPSISAAVRGISAKPSAR
jgi:hypothetical protein